jgi:cobalt-zinc-cadmium efflux system outer membrane protein
MRKPDLASLGWILVITLASSGTTFGQGPQIDLGPNSELPDVRLKLGRPLGSVGASLFEEPSTTPVTGRIGPSGTRAPVSQVNPPPRRFLEIRLPQPEPLEAATLPAFGDLGTPLATAATGGLSLDTALDLLMQRNLALIALRFEIPMAQADVLTASLRANPIFYADAQLVPYGNYTTARPGGQTQYDVNISIPIDYSRKRQARTQVAVAAKCVTEAQFQDAVRLQVDNLYTLMVDIAATEEVVRYNEAYVDGLTRMLRINESREKAGSITHERVDSTLAQVERAQLQLREARDALITSERRLALLLNLPVEQIESAGVTMQLRDDRPLPESSAMLIQRALSGRPDLVAYRMGMLRAESEVRLAKANRHSDAYLLYQPYTLQDNRPYGLKSPTSWAVGLTVAMPVFNRNQGNIARSEFNVAQTRVEMQAAESQVAAEVELAVREFELSRAGLAEIENEVLPASKRVHQTAINRFQTGIDPPESFFEAQREYNEVIREYRNAIVRHRRSMLDLNTAVGARLFP